MSQGEQSNQASVRLAVRGFVVNAFLLSGDAASFADSESFIEKGIIDSTGILELMAFLEKTYVFSIRDEEMVPDNLDSVDKVCSFVARKTGAVGT